MNPKHMLLLIILLIGSDLAIGMFGHFQGSDEESFEEYITDQDTWNELALVFIFALVIVVVIHFGFKI